MIKPEDFFNELTKSELEYFTGVPDSLLKNLCACITTSVPAENNIIAANEGGAMGLAIGYYLSTGKVPVVYMQNSGLGNIVNPLLSLADGQVYGIPVLFIIGWRGEILPGGRQLPDEPQHKKQGQVTQALLDSMGVEYAVIDKDTENYGDIIRRMTARTKESGQPTALLIRKGSFDKYILEQPARKKGLMSRERAIEIITGHVPDNSFFVATTGMAGRELYEIREKNNQGHEKDFLVVGGMGHASQIACEISKRSRRNIYCLDGDGAYLMHMGSSAINRDGKFCHIVLNNNAHDSVGGQPTAAGKIDIAAIAGACGYRRTLSVCGEQELSDALAKFSDFPETGTCLIEVNISKGARADLGRPTLTSMEMKHAVMHYLGIV